MSIYDVISEPYENDRKNICYSVMVGVVTNIDDPDKQGKVKVKLLTRDTSNDETNFIRVATNMSGKKWGSFFNPEVGDEVLVAFANGDISRPYVIGSLWNKDYTPPTEIKDSKNDIRMIKTKSGHQIIFNDESDKESITVQTPKELKIILDDKDEKITISDKSGNNILTVDSKNGVVSIKADKKIELASGSNSILIDGQGGKIAIESGNTLQIKSQQVTVQAGNMLQVKSSNVLQLEGSGPASLKGAMVKIN